jgi:hypothetical protein
MIPMRKMKEDFVLGSIINKKIFRFLKIHHHFLGMSLGRQSDEMVKKQFFEFGGVGVEGIRGEGGPISPYGDIRL